MFTRDESDCMPLTDADWNFDPVPDSEIIACCLWEYGRESTSMMLASDLYWCGGRELVNREEYDRDPELKTQHDAIAASIRQRVKASGFDYAALLKNFWATDLATIGIYDILRKWLGGDAEPWRKCSRQFRSSLAEQVSSSFWLRPLSHAQVGELEQLWKANRIELDEVRARPSPADDDRELGALFAETKIMPLPDDESSSSSGTVAVAFSVDFARFTNREIAAEFARWLTTNRPKQSKQPKRVFPDSKEKGRKLIEYRVALERLGLMRLLHWHTPAEIRRNVPRAWKKYGRKKPDFRREVREACKFFHRIFPFLSWTEQPDSAARLGVWFPALMKECDKLQGDGSTRRGH